MIKVEAATPSPELSHSQTLADLSRNASVISTSSSSSSTSLVLKTPRPRPARTFSSPRSRSPANTNTPRSSKPPAYLAKELGLAEPSPEPIDRKPASRAQSKSKSRSNSANGRLSAENFEFGEILGEGAYSTVLHVTHRATRQEYAVKVLDKGHLKRNNKLQTALAEKNTLVRLGSGHPGIVRLHWAFQDDWSLYFVLDLARNGELQSRISRMGSLSIACARYYTAQLVDALDYMHLKGVIHRDLKPENLLLDDAFRIKITDFGTGKLVDVGGERAKTFVGTAQYVSPELLEANETSKSSDLWALGCIVFQMISGRFAFQGLSEYLTWQKIKQLDYTFPDGFDREAEDLVRKLLVRDPAERLGAGAPGSGHDMQALRAHPFLAHVNWQCLWTDAAPPLEPGLVRRESPQSHNTDQIWDDMGATWDELVNREESQSEGTVNGTGNDGIGWASDAEGQEYNLFGKSRPERNSGFVPPEEIGPHGELPDYAIPVTSSTPDAVEAVTSPSDAVSERTMQGVPANSNGTVQFQLPGLGMQASSAAVPNGDVGAAVKERSSLDAQGGRVPIATSVTLAGTTSGKDKQEPEPESSAVESGIAAPVPVPVRDSYSTSSSDGSPVEKLGAALEAMGLNRGRLRTRSPQRNGTANGAGCDWASVLAPGETMLFNSPVEETVLKRRTSRLLLPLPVTPKKPKLRQLALTSHRLLCLKQHKNGRGIGIKSEFYLRPSEKEKEKEREKDARSLITEIAKKSDREFVVLTTSKSVFYSADNETLASTWVQKITGAMVPNNQSRERKPSANATAPTSINTAASRI